MDVACFGAVPQDVLQGVGAGGFCRRACLQCCDGIHDLPSDRIQSL